MVGDCDSNARVIRRVVLTHFNSLIKDDNRADDYTQEGHWIMGMY